MKKLHFSLLALMAVALISFTACSDKAGSGEEETTEETTDSGFSTGSDANATGNAMNVSETEASAPTGPTTTITFEETTFDFGDTQEGEKVTHAYKFTNTGDEPLVISNAKGSCGCTVPQWPKNPIPPGESGEIMVEFNSKGKPGKQTKRVTITANTDPAQTFLQITGNVIKAGDAGEEG